MFAIVAAFGVVMATATALLPILQQAHALNPYCIPGPPAGAGGGGKPLSPPTCARGPK